MCMHITHDYTSKLSASYFHVLSLYAKFAKMEIPNIMGFAVICCSVCQVMSLLCHSYCIVWRESGGEGGREGLGERIKCRRSIFTMTDILSDWIFVNAGAYKLPRRFAALISSW